MAFPRKQQERGGGNSPVMSVALSVKQGRDYIKGPSFGFWPNDQGGPAFKGTLKEKYLEQVLEFLSNAHEAGLPVHLAMFDNSERSAPSGGGFKKPGGFKPGGFKKPNPFKAQQPEQEQEEEEQERPF